MKDAGIDRCRHSEIACFVNLFKYNKYKKLVKGKHLNWQVQNGYSNMIMKVYSVHVYLYVNTANNTMRFFSCSVEIWPIQYMIIICAACIMNYVHNVQQPTQTRSNP